MANEIIGTTIHVRSGPYENDGKFGKQYKVLATDGIYYEQNKPFPQGTGPGSKIAIEYQTTTNPKYMKIKKIITNLSTNANPTAPNTSSTNMSKSKGEASTQANEPSIPDLTPELMATWIRNADRAMEICHMEVDVNDHLESTLVEIQAADRVSRRISAEQAKRWGK